MTHPVSPHTNSPRPASIAVSSAAAGAFIALLGTWAVGSSAVADTTGLVGATSAAGDTAASAPAPAQHPAPNLPATAEVAAYDHDELMAMCAAALEPGVTSVTTSHSSTDRSNGQPGSHHSQVVVDVDIDASHGGGSNGGDGGTGGNGGNGGNGGDGGNGSGGNGGGNDNGNGNGNGGDNGNGGTDSGGGSLIDADIDLDAGGLLNPGNGHLIDADVDLNVGNTSTGTGGSNLLNVDVLGEVGGLLNADADVVVGNGSHDSPGLINLDVLGLLGSN